MRIDVSSIDRERFHVNNVEVPGLGPFLLVVPFKAMWQWNRGEEHLRSLLCRLDGEVVSAGFPKFFNLGERPDEDATLAENLVVSRLMEKVDGSLLIRSVIDGRVHFRTRGCPNIASDMHDDVMRLIEERYRVLLDPSTRPLSHPGTSFLMEYISPKNRIVVGYDEPGLVGIGLVDFSGDELLIRPYDEMDAAMTPGLPTPIPTVAMPKELGALQATVKTLKGREGIVAWTPVPSTGPRPYRMHLCKLKSDWYIRLHALRSQATPRYIREYAYLNGIRDIEALRATLAAEGFDWETVSYIGPLFEECMQLARLSEKAFRDLEPHVERLSTLPTRKDIALEAMKLAGGDRGSTFSYIMARCTGKDDVARDIADATAFGMTVNQLRDTRKSGVPTLDPTPVEFD